MSALVNARFLVPVFYASTCGCPDLRGQGVILAPCPAGQVEKVAVARMAPVVVTRRAPVSGPLGAGSGLPQYP